MTEAAELPFSRAEFNEHDETVLEAGMCFRLIPDLKLVHEGGVVFGKGTPAC